MASVDSAVATSDSSNEALTGRERSLANLRKWQPGQSGNPSGRRDRGLSGYIRQQTASGTELVDYVLSVLRDPNASTRHRLQAADWLGDRGFGRPAQSLEFRDGEGEPTLMEQLQALSPEEREEVRMRALREIARRTEEFQKEHGAEPAEAQAETGEPRALPAASG